jgi:hypothetical protein
MTTTMMMSMMTTTTRINPKTLDRGCKKSGIGFQPVMVILTLESPETRQAGSLSHGRNTILADAEMSGILLIGLAGEVGDAQRTGDSFRSDSLGAGRRCHGFGPG